MKARVARWIKRIPGVLAARDFIGTTVLASANRRRRFTETFLKNYWQGSESRSGRGSGLAETAAVRAALLQLCREHGVRSLLDAPCGDFFWMKHVDLGDVDYIGADIVKPLIETNRTKFANAHRQFLVCDIVAQVPPRADLVLCRDLFVHLTLADIKKALLNLKRSEAAWLLTTSFTSRAENTELVQSDWRPINLQRPPFDFPPPSRVMLEYCAENDGAHADKSLCLWRMAELP